MSGIFAILKRFRGDRRGSAAIMFGVAALPLLFLFGMSLDYVTAARKREKLDALADSAALAAVTPVMMGKTADQAKTVATNVFNSQAGLVSGVTFPTSTKATVTATDAIVGTVVTRTVVISYQANSPNVFATLLGRSSIAIAGSSTASTTSAPNTDFYLALDTSPSMAIAATQDGIDTMVGLTKSQGGCAFACHQTNPAADNLGNPKGVDNYQVARDNKVTLRIDLVVQAAQNLMDFAQKMSTANQAVYRMGVYTYDYQVTQLQALTTNLSTAKTAAGNAQLLTMYKNGWRTSSTNDDDQDTDWDGMLNYAGYLPAPGKGTNNSGDTPQEVMFLVTDGVADESNGGRKIFAMGGTSCDAIKARGIRIAVLYTTYNPLPTNDFYNQNVKPFQSTIETTMTNCASPGLFTKVDTDDDISKALTDLFSKTVATAHLTQ